MANKTTQDMSEVDKSDPTAARIAERIDNANIEAVSPSPLPERKEEDKSDVDRETSKEEQQAKEHPKVEGPVEVQDPAQNDNRRNAEEAVVQEHGEDIRTKGNFEKLVQEKLLQL